MGSGYLGGGPYLPYATTAIAVALTDEHYTMACTVAVTVTLPPANSVRVGRIFVIKAVNISEANVTIAVTGTDHIDAGTSATVTAYGSTVLQSNGNGTWYIIANF